MNLFLGEHVQPRANTRWAVLTVLMLLHPLLIRGTSLLVFISFLSSLYVYLYPALNGCAFPQTHHGDVAPFRLLSFGDPQLEGDTSLPTVPEIRFPAAQTFLGHLQHGDITNFYSTLRFVWGSGYKLVLYKLKYAQKKIDLLGNDFYLAHIYRTLHWWTNPTHVTVLGDLLGSQWIGDEEFERRSWRYWQRVFRGGMKIPSDVLDANNTGLYNPKTEILGSDSSWRTRIFNVPGNHDVGYAGDIRAERLQRFEREFGPVNGDIIFTLPLARPENDIPTEDSLTTPALRIVLLNSMNLDGPTVEPELQTKTFEFVNAAIAASADVELHDTATILLTHIPLHKEAGTCADAPMFSYFDETYGSGIKEQNFLSTDISRNAILQGLFGKSPDAAAPARGMGRDGIILTGHDHEGCDVYHFADRESQSWQAQRWDHVNTSARILDEDLPGMREVTLRSMMGEFGGNAALVAAWWDQENGRWRLEVENCMFGVQHIWWAVHVLDIVAITLVSCTALEFIFTKLFGSAEKAEKKQMESEKVGGSRGGKRSARVTSISVKHHRKR